MKTDFRPMRREARLKGNRRSREAWARMKIKTEASVLSRGALAEIEEACANFWEKRGGRPFKRLPIFGKEVLS